jgi:hypothetical protein
MLQAEEPCKGLLVLQKKAAHRKSSELRMPFHSVKMGIWFSGFASFPEYFLNVFKRFGVQGAAMRTGIVGHELLVIPNCSFKQLLIGQHVRSLPE